MNAFLVVSIVVPAFALVLAVNVAYHDAKRAQAKMQAEKQSETDASHHDGTAHAH